MKIPQTHDGFVELDSSCVAKIENYIEQLKKWRGFNLIAKSTESDIWGWHILEGLSLINFLKTIKLPIIDFGAGGGVFGIPLTICGVEVTCIERSTNKLFFLNQVMKMPAQEINSFQEYCAIVRGVTKITELLELLPGARCLVLFKSYGFEVEIEAALKKFNFEYSCFRRTAIPRGAIVIIDKISRR
jgi:16S rRNA G527 N7-methylase RsmG